MAKGLQRSVNVISSHFARRKTGIRKALQPAKMMFLLLCLVCLTGLAAVYGQNPVAHDDTVTVKNQGFSYLYVLINDEEGDAPIDPESIEIVSGPEHADDLSLFSRGALIYQLDSETGETSDSFTYRVSDTEGNVSNTATVTIEIIDEFFDFTTFDNFWLVGEGLFLDIDLLEFVVYPGGVDENSIYMLEFTDPDGIQSFEDNSLIYEHPSPLPDPPEHFELTFSYTVQSADGTYSPPVTHSQTFSELVNVTFTVNAGEEAELNVVEHIQELTDDDLPGISDRLFLDEQSITIDQQPSKGTAEPDADDAFIIYYTANEDAAGSDEFIVHGFQDSGNPAVRYRVILDINASPQFTSVINEETVVEGEVFTFQFEADDPDGDELTFSLTQGGDLGNVSITDEGLFTFSPEFGQAGVYDFTVQVSDGVLTDEHDFTIEVTPPNEPPAFTTTFEEEAVVEGEEFTFQFEADDPDGDELTFTLTSGGDIENVSITTDGLFSFAPEIGQVGEYDFTVQASDGELTDEHDFTLIVQDEPNEPPVFTSTFEEEAVVEGEEFTFQFEADDPDGDDLFFTLTEGGDVENVSITTDGLFSFAPEIGQVGEYDFTVQVSDGELTDEHDFTLIVQDEPNEPPVFTSTFEEETVVEGEEFTFQFEADDPDGDDLFFTLTEGGDVENVSFTEEGLFSFISDFDQAGDYAFTIEVSDGELSAGHSFSMVVEEGNRPPVFTAAFDEESVVEGEEFTFQFEAEDPDGDDLFFTLTEGGDVENVSFTEEGLFSFAPDFDQAGDYAFTIEVSDGELSAGHSFSMVVEEGNRPPEARDIKASTRMNLPVTIDLTEFVSDPDGDPLEITDVSIPQHGETGLEQNAVTYTPAVNFTGTDSFEYTVADENGATDTGLITIEVLGLAFRVVDLGFPEGVVSRAFDISDEGHVTGILSESTGEGAAFLWEEGGLVTIPGLHQAFSVNNSGNLAGIAEEGGTALPAIFLNGSLVRGTTMGGNFGALYDINNRNAGVGVADNAAGALAGFLWDENGQQPVELDDAEVQLFSINDAGTMAGFAQIANSGEQAVRVLPDGTIQMLSSGSGTGSRAFEVGNGGQIVGVIQNGSTFSGAVWMNGSMQELPGLGESPTIAYGVNNGGVIVGASGSGNQKNKANPALLDHLTGMSAETNARRGKGTAGTKADLQNAAQLASVEGLRAVMWTDNEVIDLNEFIASGSGWELIEARAINNYMNIVGYGRLNGEVRAFLLTPEEAGEPFAETTVQNATAENEAVVDLLQQLKNTYGHPKVTNVWGDSHGIAELREGRYLHYRAHQSATASVDTVYYRAVDQRGAIAEGQVIFSIEDFPDAFELSQNYPNPFNSSTIIPFKLAAAGRVVVDLYSVDGRRIGVLMDQNLPRGAHQAGLGTMRLSSGVYFYRIRVSNASGQTVFVETGKMSLVK